MTVTAPPVPGESAVLDRAGTENFSVASLVLGRATRDHLLAIYGFARLVDQLGDDGRGRPARAAGLARGATSTASTTACPSIR